MPVCSSSTVGGETTPLPGRGHRPYRPGYTYEATPGPDNRRRGLSAMQHFTADKYLMTVSYELQATAGAGQTNAAWFSDRSLAAA
jgi:hypothetical protein